MIALWGVLGYLAIGVVVAVAFVMAGAPQLTHSSFTPGARILLLPASTLLWPYILMRWLKAPHTP
jgi:hypothetical protein